MATLNPKFTQKQYEVYEAFCDPQITELLVGGGGSGGKSRGIAEIVNLTCCAFPGIARLVGRSELTKLKKSTWVTFNKVFASHGMVKGDHYDVNMQDFILTYKNGSRIFFMDLATLPSDPLFDRIGSLELTYSRVEEGQEVDRLAIDTLAGRYRQKIKEYGLVGKTIITCNPSKGHLYTDFIKPQNEGNIHSFRKFIQILYTDNPYIDQKKYKTTIMNTGNRVQIARLLEGSREYDETPGKLYAYDDLIDMRTNPINTGEKYLICDPARLGEDRAVEMIWYGREIKEIIVYEKCLITELENDIKARCQTHQINMSRTLVDADGLGAGIPDHLGCKGFQNGASPIQNKELEKQGIKAVFENIKTQCYFELQKHIRKIRIQDSRWRDLIIQELDVMCQTDLDKDGKIKMISKEEVKKKIGRSPNFADCIAMRCFYELEPPKDYSILSGYING